MIKEVSINQRRGQGGGMVQVSGTGARAKEAVRILKKYKCEISGYTITGSKGERVYTYNVDQDIWPQVRHELDEIENRMQGRLF